MHPSPPPPPLAVVSEAERVAARVFATLVPEKQAAALARHYPQSYPHAAALVAEARRGAKPRGLLVHLLKQGWTPLDALSEPQLPEQKRDEPLPATESGDNPWSRFRSVLRSQAAAKDWDAWLATLSYALLAENEVVLAAPNVFARDEVQGRLRPLVEAAVVMVFGDGVAVDVVIGEARSGGR